MKSQQGSGTPTSAVQDDSASKVSPSNRLPSSPLSHRPLNKASDFAPEVLAAFDGYVHGRIDRREFFRRTQSFAVGTLGAAGLLATLAPDYANADVSPDDPAIRVSHVKLPAPDHWDGYLAMPTDLSGKRPAVLPAVLVVHENRGRNPYIEDVARRLAMAGFIGLAPDALTTLGGWPGNDDEGRILQRRLDGEQMMKNWQAALSYLRKHPSSNGRVGVVGFCYGGGVANALAVREPTLAAAVPYYGRPAPFDQVDRIKAPLMIHNGSLDQRLMAAAAPYERALKSAGIKFDSFVYQGAHHGFHNNTTPRFDQAAAELSWQRTISFFEQHLLQRAERRDP